MMHSNICFRPPRTAHVECFSHPRVVCFVSFSVLPFLSSFIKRLVFSDESRFERYFLRLRGRPAWPRLQFICYSALGPRLLLLRRQLRTRSSYLYLAFFLQSPYKSRKVFGELMLEICMKYVFTSRSFFVIMILSSFARAFFPYNIAMSDLDS